METTITKQMVEWQNRVHKKVAGRSIMRVRYLTDEEMEVLGWYKRPVVLELSDNTLLIPQMDDEGNDGGAMMHYDAKKQTDSIIPTL